VHETIHRRRQAGFSLIEVLVTTVVFSIGVLGVAGLGAFAKRATFESAQRSMASEMAYALLEEMRSNKGALGTYLAAGTLRGASLGGEPAPDWHLLELNEDGDTVEIDAASDAVLLFGHAEPFGAPVVSYGPFVMNTREEIMQAIQDYEAGKFNAIPEGRVA